MAVGVIAGAVFAVTFHLASVGVARVGLPTFLGDPASQAEYVRQQNEFWADDPRFEPYPVPEVVAVPTAQIPKWFEPFWAGLAAVMGQAVALSVWFIRPARGSALRHARGGAATGLMWVGLIPLIFGKLWLIYAILVTRGNYWATAYGEPGGFDPLVPLFPFGAAGGLLVLVVALEPWRGPQFAYRCGWLPTISVALTLTFGVVLFALGRWLFPGAV